MVKRIVDLCVATLVLLCSAPLLLLVALAVRTTLGSPVLFRQQCPGLHGRPFMMMKFRTMRENMDSNGHLLPDAERLTPLGSLLRSTSLDELPELMNVLRGEMSIVGPRPLLMEYLDLYTPEQARRNIVDDRAHAAQGQSHAYAVLTREYIIQVANSLNGNHRAPSGPPTTQYLY
jgi:sugar transferase EpsL